MIKGFIFDLDGVITDTADLHYKAWKKLADDQGWNFDQNVNDAKVLQQLDANKYFDVIGDGNSVTNSKPAPDIFLYAANALDLKPEECIVYEDAKSGIDAAKAGGFHSVGIGPKERVGHADVRFETMKEATLFEVKSHFSTFF